MVGQAGEQSRDVKTAILEAAESVFAAFGFHGTTTRAIADAADVNLAMIHYHFGSKEQLHERILLTRAEQIRSARIKRLDGALAGPAAPTLEAIIDAMLSPLFDYARSDADKARNYARMMSQLACTADERSMSLMTVLFDDLARRFVGALERSLPTLGSANAVWAYTYIMILGAQSLIQVGAEQLTADDEGDANIEETYRRTFKMLSGGIRSLAEAPRPPR